MFNCSISLASLNVRGLKDLIKRKALFLFCKGRKPHWGDLILFSHGTNKSAGVAVCFNRFPGDIIAHRRDDQGHWLMVVLKIDSYFFYSNKCVWI